MTTVLVTASSPSPGPFTVNVYVPSACVPVVGSPLNVTFFFSLREPVCSSMILAILKTVAPPSADSSIVTLSGSGSSPFTFVSTILYSTETSSPSKSSPVGTTSGKALNQSSQSFSEDNVSVLPGVSTHAQTPPSCFTSSRMTSENSPSPIFCCSFTSTVDPSGGVTSSPAEFFQDFSTLISVPG